MKKQTIKSIIRKTRLAMQKNIRYVIGCDESGIFVQLTSQKAKR